MSRTAFRRISAHSAGSAAKVMPTACPSRKIHCRPSRAPASILAAVRRHSGSACPERIPSFRAALAFRTRTEASRTSTCCTAPMRPRGSL